MQLQKILCAAVAAMMAIGSLTVSSSVTAEECVDYAFVEENVVNADTTTESNSDETDASHFTYTNYGDSIAITGFDGSVDDVVIPSEIEDLPVTEIGEYAFASITVNSVVVSESVMYIAKNAFQFCDPLTEITILNPSCEIYDSYETITNCYIYLVSGEDFEYYTGTIYGYADSTAQTYAETYGYTFTAIEESSSTGTLHIVDENDDVSAGLESEIIAQYAAAYPDVDLSDFSLVFLPGSSYIYENYSSTYCFAMYYQNTYLLCNIVTVYVRTDGEVEAGIVDESLIDYCLSSLDPNYLSEEEILRYVCCEADDNILSDEPLSITLAVGKNFCETVAGVSLTYAITYEYTDGERIFFFDAYTGMGLAYMNGWDDGIQYGWKGMMQLSYSEEDDVYTFTVESTYSDLDGWLTLADVDTGEELAVMTEAGTTEDGYYRYTCSVTLPSDTDTTKTLYAYIEHDDLWPGDVSELEVSNFITVEISGTQTTTTTTYIYTTTETETTIVGCKYIYLDTEPDKTTYSIGEELDLTGLLVSVYVETWCVQERVSPIDASGFTIDTSAYDNITAGTYPIYVSYSGALNRVTIEVEVIDSETTVTTVSEETTTTTTETTTTTSTTTENGSSIVGDVNLDGTVSLADTVFLNKYISGAVSLNDQAYANADVNADGSVDSDDALTLLKF
ncbi:MAG: bacterial Ig-like domain-containing protein [Ruminococcus sp.]|nr:bacterial Ig-like domain-containing protein [Ruminococcus sp.]